MCSDGTCALYADCSVIPACSIGLERCWDGSCAPISTCADEPTCSFSRCEDGICREECLRFNGCPLDKPYHCENRECAENVGMCDVAEDASGKDHVDTTVTHRAILTADDTYADYGCETGCMADVKATSATYSINRDEDYTLSIAIDAGLVTRGELTIPSGSLVSSASKSTIYVKELADSSGRKIENKIQFTRQDMHGDYKTYAQTVLSPAFKCSVTSDVADPFVLPLIYKAHISPFPIQDGYGVWSSGYDYDDVCFATVDETSVQLLDGSWFQFFTWRCLVTDDQRAAFPVRVEDSTDAAGVVSFTLDTCNSEEGAVYAFIHAPSETVIERSEFLTWLSENETTVMLAGIAVGFVLFGTIYTLARCIRYRKKYKAESEAVKKKKELVNEMEQFGGKAGSKDYEVTLVTNPMVLQMKQAEDLTPEDLDKRKAEALTRQKRAEARKAKLDLLRMEKNSTQKQLDQLKQQLLQATSEQKQLTVTVVPSNDQDDDFGFDDNDDDDDDGDTFARAGLVDDDDDDDDYIGGNDFGSDSD